MKDHQAAQERELLGTAAAKEADEPDWVNEQFQEQKVREIMYIMLIMYIMYIHRIPIASS